MQMTNAMSFSQQERQKPLASSASYYFICVKVTQGEKHGLISSSVRTKNNNLPSARKKNPIESP